MGGVGVFHHGAKMTITNFNDHYLGCFLAPKDITR
jgi:hypothetical protein